MRVVFIGGGNMATALISGLFKAGWSKDDVAVVEPNETQQKLLSERFGLAIYDPSRLVFSADDCIVWAVKPQHLKEAAKSLFPRAQAALHVSIAAGLRAPLLARWFGTNRVIRAMPNSAATVGCGVTGLFALDAVTESDRDFANSFFKPTGDLHWVDSDDRIDALTAVSGSGPAYVFHFLESFQSAAEDLGFDSETARELTLQTAYGAIKQIQDGDDSDSVSTLRSKVTSAKGTTEAALGILAHRKTSAALVEAVHEAYTRAAEIANEWDSSSKA